MVLRQTVNLFPPGKHWGFKSLPTHCDHRQEAEASALWTHSIRTIAGSNPVDHPTLIVHEYP